MKPCIARNKSSSPSDDADQARWRQLWLLALVELLAMSLWFSASAVAPAISQDWRLSSGQTTWLTMSVQLGFVAGALLSAILNLPDVLPGPRLIAISALAGSCANAAIALAVSDDFARTPLGLATVVGLRGLTGVMLAGVYPPGMRLMASWFRQSRGLAIGILVGALTIGSATPHLTSALAFGSFLGLPAWRVVLLVASSCALAAALIAHLWIRGGPHLPIASRFDLSYAGRVWSDPALRRANFGYLGHMFELYAMWTWVPRLLQQSYDHAGWPERAARAAGFATIAIGAIGCLVAGFWADSVGRCRTTIASLAISGLCAVVAGSLYQYPGLLTVVCLVWGLAVVADSAQFSAAVSELCDPQYVGTALTIQTCAGFLLTVLTIRFVPLLQQSLVTGLDGGWALPLALLAAGPAFGIFHMTRLVRMEQSRRMAGGNR